MSQALHAHLASLQKAILAMADMTLRNRLARFGLKALIVGAGSVLVASCAADRSFGEAPTIEVTQLDTLPEPKAEITYSIGPQEKLEVVVVGADELGGVFLTDQDGNIAYPYLGIVPVGGKSPKEASVLIADGLRGEYVLDPQVRVLPEEIPESVISVGGEITRPGAYPAIGKPTLLTVINQAEGLDQFAQEDDVLVMRTVDKQRYIGLYNLEAIQRGNYADPRLYPGDIVMVGDSPAKRRIATLLGLTPAFTSLIVLLDRLN